MSEELKQALQTFATKILVEGSNLLDAGKEQIPLVVQEYLAYTAWESGFFTLGGVLLMLGAVGAFKKGFELLTDDDVALGVPLLFAGIFGTFAGGGMVANYFPLFIKVLVAPRLIVLEWVRGLL